MIPSSRFQSISWKFLAVLIPAVTLMAVVVLVIYSYTKVLSSEDSLIEKTAVISQVHSQAVAHPLWTLDIEGLQRSIQTIALHPEISCVDVFDTNDRERYQWPEDCVLDNSGDRKLSKALNFDDHVVGTLNLFYTKAPLTQALKREILIGALFFFLLVSVAGVVAFAALRLTVGRPVQRLIASIRRAETDDVRVPVIWSSQDELGRVITAYNHMIQQVDDNTNELIAAREQAESAAFTKSRFLANMSHELRTPLNAVIGITEMLREEAEDDNKDTEPYDRVAGSGRHLLHLIDDILDFSKIEAGKIELLIEEVDLKELLNEVMSTVKSLANNRGNDLTLKYVGVPKAMTTDQFRLRQIIINLLSNACKFTENGSVSLEVSEALVDGIAGTRFVVSDTGIGISKEQSELLFQDFSQADSSTTRQYGGTGLGLAISQRLCNLLGGNISMQSALGNGSEFTFWLPISPAVKSDQS